MWLEILSEIYKKQLNNGPLSYLNMRCDLHISIYVIEALKSVITFSNVEGKFIIEFKDKDKDKDTKKSKKIKDKKLFYWWQIIRFNEIYEEEKKLIQSFEDVKRKMQQIQTTIPKIEPEDPELESKQQKITELNIKLSKLAEYLNTEGPKLKHKLTLLSNFRNTCNTFESFKQLLSSIQLYLEFHK